MYAKGLAVPQPSPTSRVGEHRGLVLEKVQAFTGNDVNPIVYLTVFDDRAELPETVIAQVDDYLLLG